MSGGITARSMATDKAVIPNKFLPELYEGRYFRASFPGPLPVGSAPNGYGDPTGATGDTDLLAFRGVFPADLGYHIKGAGQTLLAPSMDFTNGGLLAGLDVANSEGVEYLVGSGLTVYNPFAVKCGDVAYPASFVRLKCKIADVSGCAEMAVGWRKAEAYQANLDDYDELACLNVLAGDLKQETILNGAATATTDTGTNVADNEEFTIEAQILGRRARFLYNGVDVSAPHFDFDANEIVVPFIFFLQTAGGTSAWRWSEIEAGRLFLVQRDGGRR